MCRGTYLGVPHKSRVGVEFLGGGGGQENFVTGWYAYTKFALRYW